MLLCYLPNLLTTITIEDMRLINRPPRYLSTIVLVIILAAAAALRFYNLNWDNGIFAHPDERSTVAFYAPTIHWPQDFSTLLNPRASTLNPFWDVSNQSRRSYTYGHFPLYTLVLTANFLHDLTPVANSLPFDLPPGLTWLLTNSLTGQGFALIGRALMALSDLVTVYLVFLLGRRLYGVWGGLLAASLSAFTVLQVQLAHFFAVDPVSTTFTLLALYGAILMYDRQSAGAAILTGLGVGLAVASKFSALPIAFAPVAAVYLAARHPRQPDNESSLSSFIPHPSSLIGLALLALSVAFLVFTVTSPFVLLDFENFKRAVIDEQGAMISGAADFPFTRQYRNTWPYLYFIEQQLRWGMGWPLGLLALAGTLWGIIQAVRGKAQPGEWLILGWIVLYFGPTGLFLAKFMRYMIPIVPLLTLFGAGLVTTLWQYKGKSPHVSMLPQSTPESTLSAPHQSLTKIVAVTLAVIALVGSVFWALAFVNGVYGTEHSWVTFSRWIYANVPDGSCIAWEHWDDRLPTDLPEPNANPGAHRYFQPQLPMYDDDNQQKYELLRDTLLNCDYIVLATNRLWRTIPGLPQRYPMSTRYYAALFSGELGFEQLYTVETPPQLGPFKIDDQSADESFTVYDHPKPILFKKTRQLTQTDWDALLGHTWEAATPGYVGPPTLLTRLRSLWQGDPQPPAPPTAPTEGAKSLLLTTPVDQLPVVDDFRWNTLANNSSFVAILVWWLAVMIIGLAAFPLTFWLFYKLPDRGYILSKSLGLLLVSYFVWINSSLGGLSNTAVTAGLGLVILTGCGLGIAVTRWSQLRQFWREQRRLILAAEVVFVLVFLFFVCLRLLNPDLWQPWQGGEKMLEIGFLHAVVKSASMPPYDPFFAGGIMNYYYYGMFLVGILIKLTGIQPTIAFNLAVPLLAALTAVNVLSLAGNLGQVAGFALRFSPKGSKYQVASSTARISIVRYSVTGLAAVLFVVFIGNLEGAAQLMRELGKLSASSFHSAIPGLTTLVLAAEGVVQALGGASLSVYNYWDPTRVITETINEFPYFSFLFADLHPHMIGLPFTALFLSLVYHWLRPESQPTSEAENQQVDEATIEADGESRQQPNSFSFSLLTSYSLLPTSYFLLRWLSLPFVLGAIAIINTWDLPTYLGLMLAAFLLNDYRRLTSPLTSGRVVLMLAKAAAFAGVLLAVSYLLYAPFFTYYQAIDVGLGLVRTQTPLEPHLKIWGFFLFVLIGWLWLSLLYPTSRNGRLRLVSVTLRRWRVWPRLYEIYRLLVKEPREVGRSWFLPGLGGVLLAALGLFLLGYRVPAYLLPLVTVALLLLRRPEVTAETAYLNLLTFTGLLVLLGVEFFFLRDWLGGGDYYRMNTLFKFYIQVWLLLGVASGVILPHLWLWSRRWPVWTQVTWQAVGLALLLAVLVYPLLGTRTRINDRFPGDGNRPAIGTLDGLAYMTVGVFEWPAGRPVELSYDYAAIRWLQEHVSGTPIIAEAKIGYYREGGMRVAAYTGLPSVLGGLHQNEQRYASQIGQRDALVNDFWTAPDLARTGSLLAELNISYIYVGQVERITYGNHVGDKFDQLAAQGILKVVFENEKTKIYQFLRNQE